MGLHRVGYAIAMHWFFSQGCCLVVVREGSFHTSLLICLQHREACWKARPGCYSTVLRYYYSCDTDSIVPHPTPAATSSSLVQTGLMRSTPLMQEGVQIPPLAGSAAHRNEFHRLRGLHTSPTPLVHQTAQCRPSFCPGTRCS